MRGKKKPKKQTLPPITRLKRKADELFSKAIRYRDGESRDDGWWSQCITCEVWRPISMMHAGHFQKRGRLITRWDDENVNAQCPGCNTYRDGEQYKHGLAIDLKYGEGTAKKLYKKAKEDWQPPRAYLEQVIADSKEQIRFYENQV